MWNFKEFKMKFSIREQQYMLQGEKRQDLTVVDDAQLNKLLTKTHQLASAQLIVQINQEPFAELYEL